MGLTIDVKEIPPGGVDLEGAIDSEEVELGDGMVTVAGDLEYNLRAEVSDNELFVKGRLKLPLMLVCSLCAKRFGTCVSVENYSHNRSVSQQDTIDLTESLREDIIMALPVKPICSESCKGLCPRCGKDLNERPCSCNLARGDTRWKALDDINLQPENQ